MITKAYAHGGHPTLQDYLHDALHMGEYLLILIPFLALYFYFRHKKAKGKQ